MSNKQVKGQMTFDMTSVKNKDLLYTPTPSKSNSVTPDTNSVETKDYTTKTHFTKAEAQELFLLGIEQVKSANIPMAMDINPTLRFNNRQRNWGRCTYRSSLGVPYGDIEITTRLLDTNYISIMTTIVHEILHCAKNCKNHDKQWVKYANIMNAKYGYKIKRVSSNEEKGIEFQESKYNYVLQCERCGAKLGFLRISDNVRYPDGCVHRCNDGGKGKLKRIK